MKRYKDAENIFKEILFKNEKDFIANARLGWIHYDKKDYNTALVYYNNLITFFPDNPGGYNNVGNIYRIKKEYDKAFFYIYKALELSPRDPISTLTLAEIYAQLNNTNEFYKNFELALSFGISEETVKKSIEMEEIYKPFLKDSRFINILKIYNIDLSNYK